MRIPLKTYTRFTFTLIAIAFLILNSFSSKATVLKKSFENSQFTCSSLLHTAEATEDASFQTAFKQSSESDFPLRHSSPNRLLKKESNSIVFEHKECLVIYSFVSNNLLRPTYYHFLFRFNLF
jgi:hypothetical protein